MFTIVLVNNVGHLHYQCIQTSPHQARVILSLLLQIQFSPNSLVNYIVIYYNYFAFF